MESARKRLPDLNVEKLSTKRMDEWFEFAESYASSRVASLQQELDRFKALDQHLPPGYAIGDDATAELAVELVEAKEQLRTLTGIAGELTTMLAIPTRVSQLPRSKAALEKFSDWEKTQGGK